jgi:hypothetical protein
MTKVFIGGSIKITRLNKDLERRIDNIIQKEYVIFIGDAPGADKAVQKYLFDKMYKNVRIFCMGNECRNNAGNWKTSNIIGEKSNSRKDYFYYSIKDMEMAREADYGFMIWDGKSKGTLNNIINLLKLNKKILAYFSPTKEFCKLINLNDLENLLNKCEKNSLEFFEQKLKLSQIPKKEKQQEFHLI